MYVLFINLAFLKLFDFKHLKHEIYIMYLKILSSTAKDIKQTNKINKKNQFSKLIADSVSNLFILPKLKSPSTGVIII